MNNPFHTYFKCYMALVILLGLTVLLANMHIGHWSYAVAFAIASIKAILIVFFFMHAQKRNFLFIITGYLLFSLSLLLLTLADFSFRIGNKIS